jgi:hypothetical protein
MRSSYKTVMLASVVILAAGGCGGSVALAPVEGVVTLDGQPLADASVSLGPTKATEPGPFVGTTDASGKFTLGAVDNPGGGAAPGEYLVMITTVKQTGSGLESDPPPTQREVVPMAYRDGTTKFTVPAEGTTSANFTMTSR